MKRARAIPIIGVILLSCATATPPPAASAAPSQAAASVAPTATPLPILKAKAVLGAASGVAVTLPYDYAQAKHYFEAEGLQIEWTQTNQASTAMAAVLAGNVDFGVGGMTAVVTSALAGQNIKAFGAISAKQAFTLVVKKAIVDQRRLDPRASIKDKVQGLKGLKIGTSGPGSTVDLAMRYVLTQNGLDPDRDVELVALNSSTQLAAFTQGKTDASLVGPPVAEQELAAGGVSYIVLQREVPIFAEQLSQVLFARSTTMNEKPEVMTAAARAITHALRDIKNDPEGVKRFLGQDVQPWNKLAPDLWDAVWANSRDAYPTDATMTEDQALNVVRFDNAATGKKTQASFDQLVTNKFAEAAKSGVK